MFDTEIFSEITDDGRKNAGVGALKLFFLANSGLRRTRKLFTHGTEFCHKGKQGEILHEWLTENFARLEEALVGSVRTLMRMGRLRGKGKLPFYFDVFYRMCEKPCKMDEKLIDEILCKCSDNMKNPDYKTARSLVPLFISAVCIRICECFEAAERDFGSIPEILTLTENLFYTLDSLCNFDEERAVSGFKIERVLSKDSLYPRLTDETKASYRRNLSCLAKKNKTGELDLAESLVGEAGKSGHVGEFLCDRPKGGKVYLALLFGLTLLFTLLLCMISPLLLVSVFFCLRM